MHAEFSDIIPMLKVFTSCHMRITENLDSKSEKLNPRSRNWRQVPLIRCLFHTKFTLNSKNIRDRNNILNKYTPMSNCLNLFHIFFFFYDFIYLVFREGKGGRKRGRETLLCGCLSHIPYWGTWPTTQACTLDWESNQQPFGSQASSQSTEPHQPEPTYFIPNNFVCPHLWAHFLSHFDLGLKSMYGTSSSEVAGTVLWSVCLLGPHTHFPLSGLLPSVI